ncbi:hypothetical protein IAQ61_000722 [Plenodomus lingam]|uniref:uncharacterized protein n=1 Tax=Leptosphaeria maculans TaxID=5022 RepID=UPI0033188C88|nr:hypothetical protein IAQ61_000722 [Plenodomus lingam]
MSTPPRGTLPHRTTVIIISILSTTLLFATILATIHLIRKRRRTKAKIAQSADIEATLQRARLPVLTLDTRTTASRTRGPQHSARALVSQHMHMAVGQVGTPVSLTRVRAPSLPLPLPLPLPLGDRHVHVAGVSRGPVRVLDDKAWRGRSPVRYASLPPGVGGRNRVRCASQPRGVGERNAGSGLGRHGMHDRKISAMV